MVHACSGTTQLRSFSPAAFLSCPSFVTSHFGALLLHLVLRTQSLTTSCGTQGSSWSRLGSVLCSTPAFVSRSQALCASQPPPPLFLLQVSVVSVIGGNKLTGRKWRCCDTDGGNYFEEVTDHLGLVVMTYVLCYFCYC